MLKRPIEHVEETLIRRIMDGTFPFGSKLPNERDLSEKLGVTRPTLREALRRLERDGWLIVQHGKSTCVNDIWRHGGLNILSSIMRYSDVMPTQFVEHLLKVRLEIAPAYTREAIVNDADAVIHLIQDSPDHHANATVFAKFDWQVQHGLAVASGNPIYPLLLNGFAGVYPPLAEIYFKTREARQTSHQYYQDLMKCAKQRNSTEAEQITRDIMRHSIRLWQKSSQMSEE